MSNDYCFAMMVIDLIVLSVSVSLMAAGLALLVELGVWKT